MCRVYLGRLSKFVDRDRQCAMRPMGDAVLGRDEAWLQRYRWFTDLVEDLLEDVFAKLDG